MKKEDKVKQIVENEQIFKISYTDKYEYYLCKGSKGHLYDLVYFKGLDSWTCSCMNVRYTDCYHIEAAKIIKFKEEENELETNKIRDIPLGNIITSNSNICI